MKNKKCGIIFVIILISLGFSTIISNIDIKPSKKPLYEFNKSIRISNSIAYNYTYQASITYEIDINLTVTDSIVRG
jgi:hypothetical protein